MVRIARLLAPLTVSVYALSACGGASAPATAEDGVKTVIAALIEGKADKLTGWVMNENDVEELLSATGDAMSDKKKERARSKAGEGQAKLSEAFAEILTEAKTAGIDLSKLTMGGLDVNAKDEQGVTSVRIEAQLNEGERQHELKLWAVKTSRGLVMSRPPRINWRTTADPVVVLEAILGHQRKLLDLVEGAADAEAAEKAVDTYMEDNSAAIAKVKGDMKKLEGAMKNDPSQARAAMEEVGDLMKKNMTRSAKLASKEGMGPVIAKISALLMP